MSDSWLAIDFGTHATKAAFVNRDGKKEFFFNRETQDHNLYLPTALGWSTSGEWQPAFSINGQSVCPYDDYYWRAWKRLWINPNDCRYGLTGLEFQGEDEWGRGMLGRSGNTLESMLLPFLDAVKARVECCSGVGFSRVVVSVPQCIMGKVEPILLAASKKLGWKELRLIPDHLTSVRMLQSRGLAEGRIFLLLWGAGFLGRGVVEIKNGETNWVAYEDGAAPNAVDMNLFLGQKLLHKLFPDPDKRPKFSPGLRRILVAVMEKAKCALTHRGACDLRLEVPDQELSVRCSYSRFELTETLGVTLKQAVIESEVFLNKFNIEKQSLDRIILIGGPCRMPLVQEEAALFFGRKPLVPPVFDQFNALGALELAEIS